MVQIIDDAGNLGMRQRIQQAYKLLGFKEYVSAVEAYDEFADARDVSWGYLVHDDLAPVWVGEFGGSGPWRDHFVMYATQLDLDWHYWSLDGYKLRSRNRTVDEGWGLLTQDYQSVRQADLIFALTPLLSAAGLQGRRYKPPGECRFDPLANPVRALTSLGDVWSIQRTASFLAAVVLSVLVAFWGARRVARDAWVAFPRRNTALDHLNIPQ